jgi:hypothetical protein
MQNAHVVSKPEFYVLSNVALVFSGKSNIMLRKMGRLKLFIETALALSLHFQHIGRYLQETKCTIRKGVKFWSINTTNDLHLHCICT